MKFAVLFSQNCLLSLVFFVGLFDILLSQIRCDLRYLRYLYLMSCGTKKRSPHYGFNETFIENLPLDFDEAVTYYNQHKRFNPALEYDELNDILNGNRDPYYEVIYEYEEPVKPPSIILTTLQQKPENRDYKNYQEIPGFPLAWGGADELIEPAEKLVPLKRSLDDLIRDCCKNPPDGTCTSSTFTNACKKK